MAGAPRGRDRGKGAEKCCYHGGVLRRWFATYARLDDAGVTRFPLRAREPRDRWRIGWVFPMQGHAMLEERQTTIESAPLQRDAAPEDARPGRRERSEEHTSELQSLMRISYAVFCLQKKKANQHYKTHHKNT